MPDTKVFRVLIGDKQMFYVDTEAMNAKEAMKKISARLLDPKDDVQPVENSSANEGFKVEDAIEIKREDAQLDE